MKGAFKGAAPRSSKKTGAIEESSIEKYIKRKNIISLLYLRKGDALWSKIS